MSSQRSLVSHIGESAGSCGYCKSTKGIAKNNFHLNSTLSKESSGQKNDECDSSLSFGLIAHYLTPDVFNDILDLGWSRLDVTKFMLSRTQKRVLRAMNEFLRFGTQKSKTPAKFGPEKQVYVQNLAGKESARAVHKPETSEVAVKVPKDKQNKKKFIRKQRAEQRLLAKGIDLVQYKNERIAKENSRRRTIDSLIEEFKEGEWKHRLEIRIVSESSDQFQQTFDEEFAVYKKYQSQIHNDDIDEIAPESFKRFLASSPLIDEENGPYPHLGSYHQHYVLDGKIIAVGVIDLLPSCLSSKYFFYDPDYHFLSLGTYSALREIAFTKHLSLTRPELHYYYMGYYLSDCPKMKYKGKFRPSDLLCDACFRWVPLAECEKLLTGNNGGFTTFHPDAEPTALKHQIPLEQIGCFVNGRIFLFGRLSEILASNNDTELLDNLREKLKQLLKYAGPVTSQMSIAL